MNNEIIAQKITALKKEKNAVILAHFYQIPEIQDIADFVGDSLGLAQNAAQTDAEVIVFAGVHFMAETAKILNPGKIVLLPDLQAGCSLADSCSAHDFKKFKDKYPEHKVITYINCSAEVKALSDVICTSSNALKIVESFSRDEKLIFAPDKNLGNYVNNMTGRDMVLWDGSCHVHNQLSVKKVIELKLENKDAKIIAHPECQGTILAIADYIGSTTALIEFVKKDEGNKYIVATETGILYQMKKDCPEKKFIIVPSDETCACNDCPFMKLNTMEKLLHCMETGSPEINLNSEIIEQAREPILRMLQISRQAKLI
jgi:quinolinate synthase